MYSTILKYLIYYGNTLVAFIHPRYKWGLYRIVVMGTLHLPKRSIDSSYVLRLSI